MKTKEQANEEYRIAIAKINDIFKSDVYKAEIKRDKAFTKIANKRKSTKTK